MSGSEDENEPLYDFCSPSHSKDIWKQRMFFLSMKNFSQKNFINLILKAVVPKYMLLY